MSKFFRQRATLPAPQSADSLTGSRNGPTKPDGDRWAFEQLRAHYEVVTFVQVSSDTIYYYRTSVITLAEGLLLVAYQSFGGKDRGSLIEWVIAGTGLTLTLLWYFFEQRNQAYFNARASALREIEDDVVRAGKSLGLTIVAFWKTVPERVRVDAKLRQRFSAPLIQRSLIPFLFMLLWIGLLVVPFFPAEDRATDSPSCLEVALASNGGRLADAEALCKALEG